MNEDNQQVSDGNQENEALVMPELKEQETQEVVDENKAQGTRVKELNHRAKVAEEQVVSLQERINQLTARSENVEPYTPSVQPGEEITPEKYTQDVQRQADSLVQLRIKQYEAESRIKNETDLLVKEYPQLDPNSNEFDKEMSETVTEALEAHIRVNPYSAKPKSFVDKLMRPYKRQFEKEVSQQTERIAKQVSQAAMRPTSVRKQEKAASEMSLAELEAKLGIVQS